MSTDLFSINGKCILMDIFVYSSRNCICIERLYWCIISRAYSCRTKEWLLRFLSVITGEFYNGTLKYFVASFARSFQIYNLYHFVIYRLIFKQRKWWKVIKENIDQAHPWMWKLHQLHNYILNILGLCLNLKWMCNPLVLKENVFVLH
jgi:hypothetical protein